MNKDFRNEMASLGVKFSQQDPAFPSFPDLRLIGSPIQ